MPTDRQPTEQEMAREALGLLEGWLAGGMQRGINQQLGQPECIRWHAVHKHTVTANGILNDHGPCPGFWGEVLAAVRVLRGDPRVHLSADHPAGWVVLATVTASIIGGWTEIGEGPTEPAAILAALRAVVGATDA